MKTEVFFAINLKATYGSVCLYRNGSMMATGFLSIPEAKEWARNFCEMNGYKFAWAK